MNMPPPHFDNGHVRVFHGDCIEVMRDMADNSIDAIVTDPPYGLGFMGKEWDDLPPGIDFAIEALRVLKPGGHMLAFGGTRTWHRLAVAVEDAGFEIRDSIAWLYGSGFPKSLDVSKAIDKLDAADERLERARTFQAWLSQHITPRQINELTGTDMGHHLTTHPTQPSVATAEIFDKLRPHLPDIPENIETLVALRTVESQNFAAREVVGQYRSSIARGSAGVTAAGEGKNITESFTEAARQWQGWGTALKPAFEPIVVGRKPLSGTVAATVLAHGTGAINIRATRVSDESEIDGRWPTNVLLDETQAPELDKQSGTLTSGVLAEHHARAPKESGILGAPVSAEGQRGYGDTGGASRFFPSFRYEAKAPTHERPTIDGHAHPTVKPLDLMRWLVRLVTPPGGLVLDPFAGSGTTGEACMVEGFDCILIELDETSLPLIEKRLTKDVQPTMFGDLA